MKDVRAIREFKLPEPLEAETLERVREKVDAGEYGTDTGPDWSDPRTMIPARSALEQQLGRPATAQELVDYIATYQGADAGPSLMGPGGENVGTLPIGSEGMSGRVPGQVAPQDLNLQGQPAGGAAPAPQPAPAPQAAAAPAAPQAQAGTRQASEQEATAAIRMIVPDWQPGQKLTPEQESKVRAILASQGLEG
jgi:hypothetical protein